MSLAPPPSAVSNNLVAEALARAQALARAGGKRPGDHIEEPDSKKPFSMMQQDGAITEQIYVPDNMVGLLIGRGGENITRMQQESQCKIQMAPDSQGQPTRLCTLTGMPHNVQQAKDQINAVIANDGRGSNMKQGGGGGGGGGFMGGGTFEMMLEGPLVARVIGKGGENIKRLQEETGAKIVIIQETKDVADQKPLRISGPPDKIEYAKTRVLQVIEEERSKLGMGGGGRGRGGVGGPGGWRGGGRGGPGGGPDFQGGFRGGMGGGRGGGRGGGPAGWGANGGGGGGGYELQENFSVPSNKVGLVMGKGGETIKQICQQSGAHCQVDKNAPDTAKEKNILIKGTPDAIEQAKRMIAEKVGGGYGGGNDSFNGSGGGGNYRQNDQPYGGGGGGYDGGPQGGYGGGGPAPVAQPQPGSVQLNPATGQPDYSAQWIEYYRSLGMVKEAEMIENQVRGGGAGPTGAPQAAPAPAAAPAPQQPDYSAQWADYYRSIGKLAEAEAIEKNMRAKSGSVPPAGYPQPQAGYGAPGPQPGYQQPGYY